MEEVTEYNNIEDLKGLKGLPGLNSKSTNVEDEFSQENFNRRLQKTNAFSTLIRSNKSSEMFVPISEKEAIGNLVPDYSKYDTNIQTMADIESINDFRGKVQPWYDQIGAGVAKMGITAATTFANSTVGLVWGVGSAINQGKWSGLWNNSFMNATNKITEASEEIFKNYYTDYEKDAAWYENIFTANFLGDKLLKNAGFTIGAIGAGAITGGLINPLLSNVGKAGGVINKVALGSGRLLSTAVSSMGEASIEAFNSAKDYKEGSMTNLNAYYGEKEKSLKGKYAPRLQAILDDPSNLVPDRETGISKRDQLINNLQNEYNSELSTINIEKDRAISEVENSTLNVGNNVFLANQAVLGVSNNLQFGRLLSGGFKNAKRAKGVIAKTIGGESLPTEARNIVTTLGKGEIKAEAKKGFGKTVALKTLGNIVSEASEESAQNIASNTNRIMYSARLNNFIGAKINPDVTSEMSNGINAMGQALKEQFGSLSAPGFEEAFLGGLTGGMGVISIKRGTNKTGKTTFKPDWAGGAVEAYREAKEEYKGADVIDAINATLQDPKFVNRTQALVRHNAYQVAMDKALEEGDKFEYKNSEVNQLYSDAVMFRDAGLIDLYNEFLDGFADLDTSQVEDIKSLVAVPNSDHSIYDGLTNEEIVTDIKEKAKKTKQRVKDFLSTYDNIEVNYGDRLSKDEIEQFAWTVATTQDLDTRIKEVFTETSPILEKRLEEYDKTNATDLSNKRYKLSLNKSGNTEASNNKAIEVSLTDLFNDPYRFFTFIHLNDELAEDLDTIISDSPNDVSYVESEVLGTFLEDAAKMSAYRAELIRKANSYRNNINTLKEEVSSVKEAANAIITEDANNDLTTSLSQAESVADVRDTLDTASENSDVSKVVSTSDNPFVQSYSDLKKYQETANTILVESNELAGKILTDEDKAAIGELLNNRINTVENLESLRDLSIPNTQELSPEEFNRAKEIHNMYLTLLNDTEVTIEDNRKKLEALTLVDAIGNIEEGSLVSPTRLNSKPTIVNTNIDNVNSTTEESVIENPYSGAIYELKEVDGKLVEFDKAVPSFSTVYNYLKSKGAFEYINQGNLKVGDTLFYVKDPNYVEPDPSYNTIFIATRDKDNNIQILNVLKANDSIKKLREKITNEYINRTIKEGLFIASPTTKVQSLRSGKLVYLDPSDNRRLNKDSNIILAIKGLGNKIFGNVPGNIVNRESMFPGVVYLLTPTIENTYIASFVTTKKVTREFIDSGSNIAENIKTSLRNLISNSIATSTISIEDLENLNSYIDISKLNFQLSNDKKTFIFTGYEKNSSGEYIIETRDGVSRKKELPNKVYRKTDTPIEDILDAILNSMTTYNVSLQVDADKLDDKKYIDNLIDNEVITINLNSSIVRNNSFIMAPTQFTVTTETPIEAISESSKLEVITANEDTYFIENGIVIDTNNIPVEDNSTIELVKDLAIIDTFTGTSDLLYNYYNGNYITPNGKVLNKFNRDYLSEEDAKKVKSTISRVKSIDNNISKILKDQDNISYNKTDNGNFYISILGNTEKFTNIDMLTTSSLTSYTNVLSSIISSRATVESFNAMLDNFTNKIGIEGALDSFKVSNIDDINTDSDLLARQISMTLGRLNTADNTMTELITNYFSNRESFTKPKDMEEDVFKTLTDALNEISNVFHIRGEKVIGSPIVYSNRQNAKYAGKIDILTKDSEGRVSIYKVVTTNTDLNLTSKDKVSENILSKAKIELSARKVILENVNKLPIDKILILPIKTIKDVNDKIISFNKQTFVELTPNSFADKLVFPNIKEGKETVEVNQSTTKVQRISKVSKKSKSNFSLEYITNNTKYNYGENNSPKAKVLLQVLLNKGVTNEISKNSKTNVYLNTSEKTLYKVLEKLGINAKAVSIVGSTSIIRVNPQYLREDFKFEDKQGSKDVLFRLLNKFRNLPIQSISQSELTTLGLPSNTKAFNRGDKIYVVEKVATATDISEEVLHIFVNNIVNTNPSLFSNLYIEALNKFQSTALDIENTYTSKRGFTSENRQVELVTKSLLRYIEAEFTNVPTTIKEALFKFAREVFDFIKEGFSSVLLGTNRIIFTDTIEDSTTLQQLASILNTTNTIFIQKGELSNVISEPTINTSVAKSIQKMFDNNLVVKEKNSIFDAQSNEVKERLADNNIGESELQFLPEEIRKQKLKCL